VVDIGSRVRARRKAQNLTQEALARRADVSLNLINQLERGVTTDPHYSTLDRIAGAGLGLTVAELVEGELTTTPSGPGKGGQRPLQALVQHIDNTAADCEAWIEDKMARPPSGPGARFAWQAQVFGWIQSAYPTVLRIFEAVDEQYLLDHPSVVEGLSRLDQVGEAMDAWLFGFEAEVKANRAAPEPEALDELAAMRAKRLLRKAS
jgi:transcriptional regulator with XRE-family HTH domain